MAAALVRALSEFIVLLREWDVSSSVRCRPARGLLLRACSGTKRNVRQRTRLRETGQMSTYLLTYLLTYLHTYSVYLEFSLRAFTIESFAFKSDIRFIVVFLLLICDLAPLKSITIVCLHFYRAMAHDHDPQKPTLWMLRFLPWNKWVTPGCSIDTKKAE